MHFNPLCAIFRQAWHAWAVMNFEAVLHYKHQNQGRDEKKKLRHASGASATSEASNSDSEVDSTDHSPVPSPGQKKVNEVRVTECKALFIPINIISYSVFSSSPSTHNPTKIEILSSDTSSSQLHSLLETCRALS